MVNFIFLFFYSYYHMKKNTIKAFTLVEMLIVIVIIGILIASLMPRMSAAQWRARDVARKSSLNQISTALVAYQGDHGSFPAADAWTAVCGGDVEDAVIEGGWMASCPMDPNETSQVLSVTEWNFAYLRLAKNGVAGGWFALAAGVEQPTSANTCAEKVPVADFDDVSDLEDLLVADISAEATCTPIYVVVY